MTTAVGHAYADRAGTSNFGCNAAAIVPSDTDVFEGGLNVIAYDGTTIRITTVAGQTLDHPVVVGAVLPVQVKKVHATGTDATKIFGYW